MKLKDSFITYKTDQEILLVPAGGSGFSGLVRGNRTLEAILELLKADTTQEAVISSMKARFDGAEDEIARDVKKVISELGKIGAIDG